MRSVAVSAAAESQNTGSASSAVEEVVVTDFRQSLAEGIELKREAIGVRDSIVAEDIGKFPEQNVAESLQRIRGVFLSRDGARNEGQRISIRGLGPQYSVTTINGAPVRTTSSQNVEWSRADRSSSATRGAISARCLALLMPRTSTSARDNSFFNGRTFSVGIRGGF